MKVSAPSFMVDGMCVGEETAMSRPRAAPRTADSANSSKRSKTGYMDASGRHGRSGSKQCRSVPFLHVSARFCSENVYIHSSHFRTLQSHTSCSFRNGIICQETHRAVAAPAHMTATARGAASATTQCARRGEITAVTPSAPLPLLHHGGARAADTRFNQ